MVSGRTRRNRNQRRKRNTRINKQRGGELSQNKPCSKDNIIGYCNPSSDYNGNPIFCRDGTCKVQQFSYNVV